MMYECPNCHCDNQDMLVGMGNNMMYCEACEHEFHETKVVEKEDLLQMACNVMSKCGDMPVKMVLDKFKKEGIVPDTEMQELYQNVLRIEKRMDAQDKVIMALAQTMEALHDNSSNTN